MTSRDKHFAICVKNRAAEDLELRKVYRVLQDTVAAADGYVRVIDESGEDYLYPADYFVPIELPQKARRAWSKPGRPKRSLRPLSAARSR
jgi:hypothetical protein